MAQPASQQQPEDQSVYDTPGNVPNAPTEQTKAIKSESTQGLADKEKTGGGNFSYTPGADKSAKNTGSTSSNAVGNAVGAGNFRASKVYSKVLGNKKKKGGVGAALTAIILLFFLFFLQGPFQVIQFAQMLQRFHFASDENFMDGRTGKLIKHMRTANNPQNRNLDYFGNKFADHFEKKLKKNGMTAEYNSSARIRAITIDPKTDAGKKTILTLQEQGLILDGSDTNIKFENGKYTLDVSGTSARYRRNIVGTMVKSQGMNHAATHVSSRILKTRAGVGFHPMNNITRAADEKLRTYYDRVKEDRKTRIRSGVNAIGTADSRNATDADGKPIVEPGDESATGANGANDTASGVDGAAAADKKAAELAGKLGGSAGALTLITVFCAVKAISDAIPEIRYFNIILPLMRTGMDVVTTGAQVMAGQDLNLDELGALSDNFYDEETKTAWNEARSIQAEMGEKQTGPDIPNSAKPGKDKPAIFEVIDNIVAAVPGLAQACGAITSTIGGWIVTGLGAAIGASGPIGFIVNIGVDVIAGYALQPFISDLIRWIAGQQVPTDVAGAALGNFANYGTRLAANDVAITHGGTTLSSTVAQELKNENNAQLAVEFSHKSVFERVFDRSEPNSAVSRFMLKNHIPSNGQPLVATVAKLPSLVAQALSAFGSVFQPKTFAATAASYDYGFPAYGYAPNEIDNPAYDDPYANAAIVEPNLATLNTTYGEPCFGVTIDPTTHVITTSEASTSKRYIDQARDPSIEPKCNDRTNVELTRYRFYLADMSAAKAIACYESLDEEACTELGFGNAPITTPPSPVSTPPPPSGGGSTVNCNDMGVNVSGTNGSGTINYTATVTGNNPCGLYFTQCNLFNASNQSMAQINGNGKTSWTNTLSGYPGARSITCQTQGYPTNSNGIGRGSL